MSAEPVKPLLSDYSEVDRCRALERFRTISPYIENGVPLPQLAHAAGIPLRTARRWVRNYRIDGLAGLARKERSDKHRRKLSEKLQLVIEGMALQKPCPSVATVYRKTKDVAQELGEPSPSYSSVYRIVRDLRPAMLTMAHHGSKHYGDRFDLVHRTEASNPNAIWQADHTELDILIKDEHGKARKPWLTIILDDHSRAVAGYSIFLSSPSAIQTSLALRHAIARKSQPGWPVCGIPQILYTDHGSDFTSQHIEQVTADLKIQLIFSSVGRPRGRGKIERFFNSLNQVFLSKLPGYSRSPAERRAVLTMPELVLALEQYLVDDYLIATHSTTRQSPRARWEAGGFLPRMPDSLEQLDLLLLTVPKARRVQQDGIQFMGLRYMDPTLAAYVGEDVLLRYDPRDIAEIRVFHCHRFLCRVICQELAGQTVSLRDIVNARNNHRRALKLTLDERKQAVDSLIGAKQWTSTAKIAPPEPLPARSEKANPLKRYYHD